MYSEAVRREPPHPADSPTYEAGSAMGLAEADRGVDETVSADRMRLSSSCRRTTGAGDWGPMKLSLLVRSYVTKHYGDGGFSASEQLIYKW